jgi:hypothetical protein
MPLEQTTESEADSDGDASVPEHEYASREEADAAIAALTDDDYLKLMLVARIHWRQRQLRDAMSPDDLLHEAIVRTLAKSGRRRRWRRTVVSIIEHLDRTMESISGHAVGAVVAEAEFLDQLSSEDFDARTETPRRFHRAVAEEQLLAREQLEQIERCFEGAKSAFDLLRLRAEGYSESEITERLGMDKRSYEAARKKAEREVAKYIVRSESGARR